MNIKSIMLCLLTINFAVQAQSEVVIEPFQSERDMPAIERILEQNYSILAYEAAGCKEGTTKAYIASPNYITKVLRVDGQVVGFINYAVQGPPFLLKLFMSSHGLIHLMGVDKEHQHKGYGGLLLRHALEEFKANGLCIAFLCVKKDNHAACRFYEKEGFVCTIPEEVQHGLEVLFYEMNF